jgi:hypothetical protein
MPEMPSWPWLEPAIDGFLGISGPHRQSYLSNISPGNGAQ